MEIINESILHQLKKPSPDSHKGDNGRLLIIAGSEKFHGALLLTCQVASRIIDMVYVHTTPTNRPLMERLKSELATFINIEETELWGTIELVDTILIGPGIEESKENQKNIEQILNKYYHKKVVLDATALWLIDPRWLHKNCIVTPHAREFEHLFQCEPTADNVPKMAKYYQCMVVLKGRYDYVSDGVRLVENRTGNVGMTKGGTGDVLAGMTASFACVNDLWISACAGVYLNGLAGDRLYERVGTFYNAEDLIGELGRVWKEF